VDIDPETNPHFVRDMLDLHDIGTFDCIYSSHCLEHLYPYQVPRALTEFLRVLNPGGACLVVVPDLEDVKPDVNPIASTGLVRLCGLDLYYGLHSELEAKPQMAHHCGFIQPVLELVLKSAGFEGVVCERAENFNLTGSGKKAA
jgi:SAM-dependent methyltransferase